MDRDYLKPGQGARPGKRLTACRGLVIHWIGAPQGHAEVIRRNFERDAFGTQFICDWYDGHIIQCMPEDEVAYHVGAKSYTGTKRAICGSANPNWYLVGIECCIGDKSIPADYSAPGRHMDLGKPSQAQYAALVEFAADFLIRHKLTADNLYRHYDITGKCCHVWFVKDAARWAGFKEAVRAKMRGEGNLTQEQFNAMYKVAREAYEAEIAARPVSGFAKPSWDKAIIGGIFDGTKPVAAPTREQIAVVLDRLGLLG